MCAPETVTPFTTLLTMIICVYVEQHNNEHKSHDTEPSGPDLGPGVVLQLWLFSLCCAHFCDFKMWHLLLVVSCELQNAGWRMIARSRPYSHCVTARHRELL